MAKNPGRVSESLMRKFEFTDATSHKFWNIDLQGSKFTVHYGRIGTAGQTQEKSFPSPEAARKEHDKLVAEKVRKGYKETTPAEKTPASLEESLLNAIIEHPDDVASHMAYADYLTEQNNPRGDFIRAQLAMENESLSAAEHKKLATQEKLLLKKHQQEWLGALGEAIINPKPHPQYEWRTLKAEWTFKRGWLHSLKLENHTVPITRLLAREPAARLLERLHLAEECYEEEGEYEPGPDVPAGEYRPANFPLIGSPVLGNVKTLIVGTLLSEKEESEGYFNCHTNGRAVAGMVKSMPKLEELLIYAHHVDAAQLFSLRTLDKLRVLVLYHSDSYPLGRLAKNPSLKNLTTLRFHPHASEEGEAYIRLPAMRELVRSSELPALTHLQIRMTDAGDKGVKEIVDSGILKRLKVLDLQHGVITDKGCEMLAKCSDVTHLEHLDLSNNKITPAAAARLAETGVKLTTGFQRPPDDADDEYLFAGDIE
jgi:uncharacterized protein (TIGR02996 family)